MHTHPSPTYKKSYTAGRRGETVLTVSDPYANGQETLARVESASTDGSHYALFKDGLC